MASTNESPSDDRLNEILPEYVQVVKAAFVALLVILLMSGCGFSASKEREDLQQLGLAYYYYTQEHNPPAPTGWDDIVGAGKIDSETIERLRGAGVVVHWGMTFRNATNGAANSVLAYPKTALESGGYVLMLDGGVHRMTASELNDMLASQSAPHAGG